MGDRGKELQELHNKGQEDGIKADYDPPYGVLDSLLSSRPAEEIAEENDAYNAGYENARNQLKK